MLINRLCPTAAHACTSTTSDGRTASPSRCAPNPTAPDDTSSTSRPARRNAASDSAIPYRTPIDTDPSSRMMTLVPTFTTMRFAAASAARGVLVPKLFPVSMAHLPANLKYSASHGAACSRLCLSFRCLFIVYTRARGLYLEPAQ